MTKKLNLKQIFKKNIPLAIKSPSFKHFGNLSFVTWFTEHLIVPIDKHAAIYDLSTIIYLFLLFYIRIWSCFSIVKYG